jgi:hypothetical protein
VRTEIIACGDGRKIGDVVDQEFLNVTAALVAEEGRRRAGRRRVRRERIN